MDAKPARLSASIVSEVMMPHMANPSGTVHGGVLLGMIDRVGAVAATRHARRLCVTVSVDQVDFREPIHVGELVTMHAMVNYVHRTSLEVGVRVEAENLVTGVRRHTNSCYLTYVALGESGRPAEVPPLVTETDDERRRFAAAEQRRARRIERPAGRTQAP